MEINENEIIKNGFYDEELALAYLLASGYCFLGLVDLSKQYPEVFKKPKYTTCIYVLCNDIFNIASADAECIENSDNCYNDEDSEIIQLYKYCKENETFGYIKWLCLKRKEKPLPELIEKMKKANYWCLELENI